MISLPIDEMLLDLRAKLEMFEREESYAALDEVYRETRRIDCACEDAIEHQNTRSESQPDPDAQIGAGR